MVEPESIRRNPAATLFPEILEQIFNEVEEARRNYMLSHRIQDDHLRVNNTRYFESGATYNGGTSCPPPKSMIPPLARVCKRWKPIAERCLYHSIDIRTAKYSNPVPLLMQTLKNKPHLADLVRELRVLDALDAGHLHTWYLAGIIRACTQLAHLTVVGFVVVKPVEDVLRASLSRLTTLRSLTMAQHRSWTWPRSLNERALCSAEELLRWMTQWPDIEHVTVITKLSSTRTDNQSTRPPNPHFPHLRTFSFMQPITTQASLQALRAAAPQLETLRVSLVDNAGPALYDALYDWAPTLHTLHLEYWPQTVYEPEMRELLSQLSGLRSLYTTTQLIPPEMLHYLTALEVLEYNIEYPSHADALIDVMPRLPKLRSLHIIPLVISFLPPPAESINRLAKACLDRGIAFVTCFRTWNDEHQIDGNGDTDYSLNSSA